MDRIWGSIFSRAVGPYLTKVPDRIPDPGTVHYGAPLPAGTRVGEVRRAVQELSEDAWRARKAARPPLHRSFIRLARRHPFQLAFADVTRPRVSRFGALTG